MNFIHKNSNIKTAYKKYNSPLKRYNFRKPPKEKFFLSGLSTKRGGGEGLSTKEKEDFLESSSFDH